MIYTCGTPASLPVASLTRCLQLLSTCADSALCVTTTMVAEVAVFYLRPGEVRRWRVRQGGPNTGPFLPGETGLSLTYTSQLQIKAILSSCLYVLEISLDAPTLSQAIFREYWVVCCAIMHGTRRRKMYKVIKYRNIHLVWSCMAHMYVRNPREDYTTMIMIFIYLFIYTYWTINSTRCMYFAHDSVYIIRTIHVIQRYTQIYMRLHAQSYTYFCDTINYIL